MFEHFLVVDQWLERFDELTRIATLEAVAERMEFLTWGVFLFCWILIVYLYFWWKYEK